ncbi:MAG: hypothetical protein JO149_03255 [Gammaproteobacteria bacterium]|nr:hypothetical protein [Gammaproteobacteria bacterium]
MFRPKRHAHPLPFPTENTLSYQQDYASVTQFISLNKTIPARLASFTNSSNHQERINKLQTAIEKIDLSHPVFSDDDCQLYLDYLYQEKRISAEDYLTMQIYLTSLMQFTNIQTLAEEDQDLKENRYENPIVSWCTLGEGKEGSLIEKKLMQHLINTHFNSDYFHFKGTAAIEKIQSEIKKLNKLGKCVIKIEYQFDAEFREEDKKNECSIAMVEDVAINSPFIFMQKDILYIPSVSVIKLILKTICPTLSVDFAPIYGNINEYTLFLFHQQGLHPVNLYSPFIKSNPREVHNGRCGPLPMLLHDITHAYFGNILHKNEYDFIYQYLLPTMRSLLDLKELYPASSLYHFADLNFKIKSQPIINEDIAATLTSSDDLHTFYLQCCMKLILDDISFYINDASTAVEKKLALFELLFKNKADIQKKYNVEVEELLAKNPLIYNGNEMWDLAKEAEEKNLNLIELYSSSSSSSYQAKK